MNKEEFEKKLLELAACELSPEEWESGRSMRHSLRVS